jgi:hypothetical protein
MHFEIIGTIAQIKALAARLRTGTSPTPTPTPTPKRRRDNVVDNNVIPPGKGQQRFICPTGGGALVTERAFISAGLNGDRPGTAKFFFQTLTGGLSNSAEYKLIVKSGVSTIASMEIPKGTTQINVQYDFPDGGVITIETLARQ